MTLKSFLQEASSHQFWMRAPAYCFMSDEFSPLFFSQFFVYVEKNNLLPAPRKRLDLAVLDKKTIDATLTQSFLGSKSVFWLGNLAADGVEKSKKGLVGELISYAGPHTIIYFLPKEARLKPGSITEIIDIPSVIDSSMLESLSSVFQQGFQGKKLEILNRMLQQAKNIPLDVACMLLGYAELFSAKDMGKMEDYLANIMYIQPSLSLLSDYFFSLNSSKFFSLWAEIGREYPDMFWLAFWSEQLWKAHYVISYLKRNDFVNAKRMSFRLPYSFINTQWKKFTQQELKELYERLYLIDTRIKRGGAREGALDFLFFSYFFQKSSGNNLKMDGRL